jgi:hypothetical protein
LNPSGAFVRHTREVSRCCLSLLLLASCLFADDITPRVGTLEIFGLHKVSASKVASAVGVQPGDRLPIREEAEDRINKLSGIVSSNVQAVCCDGGKTILYIGVEEKNVNRLEFHAPPNSEVALPVELGEKYQALMDALAASLRAKNADEDLTNGYSLSADPESRTIQQELIPLVDANFDSIDQVTREAADPDARIAAAYLLQYASRTPRTSKRMGDALQYALRDPDPGVRTTAMTSLKAVMVGARLHPEQGIHIEPTWFVELMNSTQWSDRRNASLALLTLSEKRDPDTLQQIRDRALTSVVEMARWHDLQHALPGFILAGRLAGLKEKDIQDAWVKGDREPVLEAALYPGGKPGALSSVLRRGSK